MTQKPGGHWSGISSISLTGISSGNQSLLQLHDADPTVPLFELSERTSEQIFALQDILVGRLDKILADEELVWLVMTHYDLRSLLANWGEIL